MQSEDVADEFGAEIGSKWARAKTLDPSFPDFSQFQDERAATTTIDEVEEFASGAKRGLAHVTKSIMREAWRQGKVQAFGTPQEKMALIRDNIKAGAEGFARNLFGLTKAGENLAGAIADKANTDEEEVRREFMRRVDNFDFNQNVNDGILIDPKTVGEDNLLVAELAADPLNLTGVGGVVARTGKLGQVMQKIGNVPRATARHAIKGTAKIAGKPVGFITKKVGQGLESVGKRVKSRGKQAVGTTAIVDVAGTGGAATGTALTAIVGGKAVELAGRGLKNLGAKTEAVARAIASPNRQKRLLDRLHQEHGSKLAGVASKLGGTQAGDVLFNAVVDGTQAGILNAAEATLAGRDAAEIGEAFGTGAGLGKF
jgi:hypothetical protein